MSVLNRSILMTLGLVAFTSSSAYAENPDIADGGCGAQSFRVVIVLDESSSITANEVTDIRRGLSDFVQDQLSLSHEVAFVIMGSYTLDDYDTQVAPMNLPYQNITDDNRVDFDAWIGDYRTGRVPYSTDRWQDGLQWIDSQLEVPDLVVIVADGASGSIAQTTDAVVSLQSKGAHFLTFGIGSSFYFGSGPGGDFLTEVVEPVIQATPELLLPNLSNLFTADYDDTAKNGDFSRFEVVISELSDALCPDLTDTDNDGLTDHNEESFIGTDPLNPDTDGDGLQDGEELTFYNTNPLDADSDDGGVNDGVEVNAGTDPNDPDDDPVDSDGDGLSDPKEAELGTDPNNPDTDGDGLSDGEEVTDFNTDPTLADSDADGIDDGEEVNTTLTNPLNPDSDDDGVEDGDELFTFGTDPLNPDTDGGGVKDGVELVEGTDPLDASDDVQVVEPTGGVYAGACSTSSGPGSWLMLGVLLVVGRRRRGES